MREFKEKTIIITGADSAIGRAAAIQFSKEDAEVVLVGRNQDQLMATAELLPQDNSWIHDDNYMTITCDITDSEQVGKMMTAVMERFEHIDVLLNHVENIAEATHITQAALPYLTQVQGNIVQVVNADSQANTAQLTQLTQEMAVKTAKNGVRVNLVTANQTTVNPLGKSVTAEDIAEAVVFLASDDAKMITGVELPVDGGVNAL